MWRFNRLPYENSLEGANEKLCYGPLYVENWLMIFELQIMLQTKSMFGQKAR